MGSETIEFIESRLEGKFQLEINREKTRVVDLREEGASLDFLGYTFRYDRDLKGRRPAGAGEAARNARQSSVFQADPGADWRAESAPERVGELLFRWVRHERLLRDR